MAKKFKSRFTKLLIEIMATSLDIKMINRLGRRINPLFDIHKESGVSEKLTLQMQDAARIFMDYCFSCDKHVYLLGELINAQVYGIDGFPITIGNFQIFLKEIEKIGYRYDKEHRKVITIETNQVDPGWGYLENNREYSLCFVSIDIVNNSKIVRQYNLRKIGETYRMFHNLIDAKITSRNGRIWIWEGDGGIIAFHGENAIQRAVYSMLDFTLSMPIFNACFNRLGEEIYARVAIHPGKAVYKTDVTVIKSEAIDYVKMIEKEHTHPGNLILSKIAWQEIGSSLQVFFKMLPVQKNDSLYGLHFEAGRRPESAR